MNVVMLGTARRVRRLLRLSAARRSRRKPFPSKPITMIVPFPPGGVADLTGRPTAVAMEKSLARRSSSRTRPAPAADRHGAGREVEARRLHDHDGALSDLGDPEADKLLGRAPMYTLDQLAPIALISADPTILVVRTESPWKTVKDFLDDAKKRPDAISYSSSGIYGTLHVAMAMLGDVAGVTLHHVPYTGAGPAITALLGGTWTHWRPVPAR
jgi:tripartite-type tricarboxylate transporter receptor subunit TctC